MKKITKFLDYEIIDCQNSDGFVLSKDNGCLYETHLGNFKFKDDAERAAIIHFMIARPHIFSAQIYHRVIGTRTYHEFFKFEEVVEMEQIEMPESISHSSDANFTITYKGEKL